MAAPAEPTCCLSSRSTLLGIQAAPAPAPQADVFVSVILNAILFAETFVHVFGTALKIVRACGSVAVIAGFTIRVVVVAPRQEGIDRDRRLVYVGVLFRGRSGLTRLAARKKSRKNQNRHHPIYFHIRRRLSPVVMALRRRCQPSLDTSRHPEENCTRTSTHHGRAYHERAAARRTRHPDWSPSMAGSSAVCSGHYAPQNPELIY